MMENAELLVVQINEQMGIANKQFDVFLDTDIYRSESEDKLSVDEQIELTIEIGAQIDKFKSTVKSIYRYSCLYLEETGKLDYLNDFKKTFLPIINDTAQLIMTTQDSESEEYFSALTGELYEFLEPIGIWRNNEESFTERAGRRILENILQNTNFILNRLNIVPKSEAEVYNNVKIVINSAFTTSKDATTKFSNSIINYKPDILIPEISSAVEYKYAKSKRKFNNILDSLSGDVDNYKGDEEYKYFYAVCYTTKDFIGVANFEKLWKDRFPENWIGYYIVGN